MIRPGGTNRARAAIRAGAVVAGVVALVMGTATGAFAYGSTLSLQGEVDIWDTLVQYGTPHYHPLGTEFVRHTDDSPKCGGGVRFGLRIASGLQVTNSIATSGNSALHQFTDATGSTINQYTIPSGTQYVNARGEGGGCGYDYFTWYAQFLI